MGISVCKMPAEAHEVSYSLSRLPCCIGRYIPITESASCDAPRVGQYSRGGCVDLTIKSTLLYYGLRLMHLTFTPAGKEAQQSMYTLNFKLGGLGSK